MRHFLFGVPGPGEQHRGVHLAGGQHEEEGGGRGHDEGQPGLHQDQPQPGRPRQLCGAGQQCRQVKITRKANILRLTDMLGFVK